MSPRHESARAPAGASPREHFDASLAEHPVRTLPLSAVIDLLRVTHAPERIDEYRQVMQRGGRFPPVAVVRLFGRFFLADGHKRLHAHAAIGAADILVQVWPLRRWWRDQREQFRRHTGRHLGLAAPGGAEPATVRGFREAAGQIVRHWRRIGLSLFSLARRRPRQEADRGGRGSR